MKFSFLVLGIVLLRIWVSLHPGGFCFEFSNSCLWPRNLVDSSKCGGYIHGKGHRYIDLDTIDLKTVKTVESPVISDKTHRFSF